LKINSPGKDIVDEAGGNLFYSMYLPGCMGCCHDFFLLSRKCSLSIKIFIATVLGRVMENLKNIIMSYSMLPGQRTFLMFLGIISHSILSEQ